MTPPPPISTEDLLAQAGWVRALAQRLARDAASADDLAQGTLGAALARPPARDRPLRPWLARVLANLARKERRGADRRVAREQAVARDESEPPTDELLAELEQQQQLAKLVASLPDPYRTVLLRRFYRGESAAAIARSLGVPTATVRSQLARGLARLRVSLERRCDGNRQRMLGVLALAAGGRQELWAGTIISTTKILAMSTGTKLVALSGGAAAVCIGTLIWMSQPDSEGVHPDRSEVAAAPSYEAQAPQTESEEVAQSTEDLQRSAVSAATASSEEALEEAQPEEPPAPHVVFLRAVDEAGLPIAGAQLVLTTEFGLPRDMPISEPSGVDGRIELELDRKACFQYVGRENANAYVCLKAPGYASAFFVAMVTLNGRHDQGDRVLAPGGTVRGLVLDPNGSALEARVVATSGLVGGDPDAARLSGPDVEGGRPTVLSDRAGQFVLTGVHLGPTRVWATADGYQWSYGEVIEVSAGALAAGIELTLEPIPDDARIAGHVVDPMGQPVEGARITYRTPKSYDEVRLETDSAGRFSIDLEARNAHVLTTHDPKERFGPAQPRTIEAGDTNVVIELTPRRLLSVRALDPDGKPLEEVAVIAIIVDDRNDYMNQRWAHTDSEGRIQIPARATAFEVSLSESGYEQLELGPFDPEALPEEEVVGHMVREPSISGVVLFEGEPVEDAKIEVVHTFGDSGSREIVKGFPARFWSSGSLDDWRSDAEGRFTIGISGNERMDKVLLVEKEGFALTQLELVNVSMEQENEPVEVHLTRGGTLAGSVRVPSNRSREGVVIGISRGDGRPRFTRTDAAGRFEFEHLTPGPWCVEDRQHEPEGRTMSIRDAEEAPFDWNCDIREGETTVFVVDLRWQAELRVRGRLVLDGVGAAGWSAVLEAPQSADREYHLRPCVLDAEGAFAAEALPGNGRLVLRSPADEGPMRTLIAEIRVTQGLQPFEFVLGTGVVKGRVEAKSSRLRYHHNIDSGVHMESVFTTDEEGDFEVTGVPAGEVSLQREFQGSYGPGWYTLQSLQVVAGETLTID